MLAPHPFPANVDATLALLTAQDYVADRRLATAVFLALKLQRPLFLEGEAGVGKTEIAKVLAAGLRRKLIRLQCYEGLDTAAAVYEWNYPRQMIEIRLAEAGGNVERGELAHDIFTTRFLLKRPLLQALAPEGGVAPVLLIDELDRTDEPFEAYLLEVLAEYPGDDSGARSDSRRGAADRRHHVEPHARDPRRDQASLPLSLGRLSRRAARARDRPAQVRRRRAESLAREIVAFTQRLRAMDLFKAPGIAETLDWAEALIALDKHRARSADGRRHAGRAAQIPGRRRRAESRGHGAARRRSRRRKASVL